MRGWFHNLRKKSRVSSSPQHEQESKPKNSNCSLPSPVKITKLPQSQSALSSPIRWSKKYDVLVCHSSVQTDNEEAMRLVSFLEASPRSLRCFLWQRDSCPGAAIPTELYQAVQDSHCRALLITPDFLQDDWCKYMMHQALVERPMSNQMIPLVQNLSHSQYPQELKFLFYIDLSRNPDRAYTLINKTVLNYLEGLVKNEKTLDCDMDSFSNGLNEGGSSQQENKLMSKQDPAENSL
ncbi:hypothetical protein LDENG_00165180 [Lucifuga dentata]|nr:hypothetical protein LDENG_00165180 [Lucifuga dentata]